MEGARIVIIGAGNVATHLAKALDCADCSLQIYSRDPDHAAALTSGLRNASVANEAADLWPDADFYIISVSDNAIADVCGIIPATDGVVLHTSGSVDISVLNGTSPYTGVLYPLQTFTKGAEVDMHKVPVFTEASDPATLTRIDSLAAAFTTEIHHADSSQRRWLHIAAVLACNFTNHLWCIADEVLRDAGYDIGVLKPLITATVDKAFAMPPHSAQTGPARRGDTAVIDAHLNMLPDDIKPIYALLSASISHRYNP